MMLPVFFQSIVDRLFTPPSNLVRGEQKRHFVLATWMYLLGSAILLFFIPFDLFYTGYLHHAIAQAIALVAITLTYATYRLTGDPRAVSWLGSLIVGGLIVFLLATGNPVDAIFAWAAFFPAIPFFMLGARNGLIASLLFTACLGGVLSFLIAGGAPGLSPVAIYNTLGATLATTVILSYYEHGRSSAERAMEKAANTDFLTGLANRRHFQTVFELEAAQARRHRRPLTLLLVDLDHFKSINDTHGHETGDIVLRQAAQRMVEGTRRQDVVGRIGGEEFALLLPGISEEQAMPLAETLRRALADRPMRSIRVTASIGLAQMEPGDDWTSLFARADGRLYAAKSDGRNRTVGAAPAPTKIAASAAE